MATDEENSLKLLSVSEEAGKLLSVLPQRLLGLEEAHGLDIVLACVNRARVERSFTAGGRGDDDLAMGCKDFVWVSKLRLDEDQHGAVIDIHPSW